MLVRLIKDLLQPQTPWVDRELALAQVLLQSSQTQLACETLSNLLARKPVEARALLLRGTAKRLLSRPLEALADLQQAQHLVTQSDKSQRHLEMALCWQALGDNAHALENATLARELNPDSTPAYFLLTQLRLPGDYYIDVLSRIFVHLKPRTYVEIGVFEGASLKLAKSAKTIIGIDPNPKMQWELQPNMKVFKTTSDAFFANHDLLAELGQRCVDLAFIDGMHQFEFAMRDFANLERCCQKGSTILIHDCFPLDEESAGRQPRSSRWSGDVWRLIVLLKKYRQDLRIHTIGTAPTGLAVIQNLDPASHFLLDNSDRLVEEFLALDYSYLDDSKADKLNLIQNDWRYIKAMLGRSVD